MKIIERRFLRGPNLYASWPCLLAIVDLEDLDRISSADVPGFTARLCTLLPSLHRHRCSVGRPGGFIQRLRDGTYMAHVLEHVHLELQCLAGTDVGFGRTRRVKGVPRHYRVVCEYRIEPLGAAALDAAVEVVAGVARGENPDRETVLAPLRALATRHGLGPSTRAILDAAQARGIPFMRLSQDTGLFQLGLGERQRRIRATITSQTSHMATIMAGDKHLARALLSEAGIPVPKGVAVRSAEAAVRAARALRGRVVVKPVDANHGKGVRTRLRHAEDIARAYGEARRFSRSVIVEKFIEGADYRLLIVAGKLVAAARREPPFAVGDGTASLAALIEEENRNPARGDGHAKALTRIPVDQHTIEHLERQGLTLDSVPAAGARISLRDNANLSTGGTATDVTDRVHPRTARTCIRAVLQLGLDVAGVDLVCRDIGQPLEDQQGAIVEVNAAPGIRMHEYPGAGTPRAAGRAIVDALFPDGVDGRIPVVAITGTNGKTTTTLLIASVFAAAGFTTGVAATTGIFIDGECIEKGDCTGYWSARKILGSPEVQAAVLETARGGILKRGLGFDRCDVGVVLNVTADHLGLDGVATTGEMARVKRVVARVARRAVVLNAEDRHCVAMASRGAREVEVLYFSLDESNAVLQSHLAKGGRAVYLSQGQVMLASGEHRRSLFRADDLPVTLQGQARHNVANVLAAVAAVVAQGECGDQAIIEGIRAFRCSAEQNPLRLNLFEAGGVPILFDYAHNPAAYQAILATARALGSRRVVGVVTAPSDRRDEDLQRIARICAAGLDEMVVCESRELRGRMPGETVGILLESALAAANGRIAVHAVMDVAQAIREGFQRCAPGDLLLIGGSTDLEHLEQGLAHAPSAVGAGKLREVNMRWASLARARQG